MAFDAVVAEAVEFGAEDHQHVLEVVRDAAGHPSERFHLLGAPQRRLAIFEQPRPALRRLRRLELESRAPPR